MQVVKVRGVCAAIPECRDNQQRVDCQRCLRRVLDPRLDIAGLPANFMPLFAGGRAAFVPQGEQVVVHGGVSIEELIVPFVKISYLS